MVLTYYGPGQIFGEMSLLDGLPRSATATALEPMTMMILPRDVFMNYLKEHPDIAIGMMRDLSTRLRYTSTYLEKVIAWSQKLARGEYSETLSDYFQRLQEQAEKIRKRAKGE